MEAEREAELETREQQGIGIVKHARMLRPRDAARSGSIRVHAARKSSDCSYARAFGYLLSARLGRDVRVQPEQVVRIHLRLERDQPFEIPAVGRREARR